jgi:hypothetical protein
MIRAHYTTITRVLFALLSMVVAAGRLHAQEEKPVPRGRVEGTVWDSTRAQPLVGSVVQLINASDRWCQVSGLSGRCTSGWIRWRLPRSRSL